MITRKRDLIVFIIIVLGVVFLNIYLWGLENTKPKLQKDVHYKLNVFQYDTLWIKYDTTIYKSYSVDKPDCYK